MASKHIISKGLTEAQYQAFEQARQKSGLNASDFISQALQSFCVAQGVQWPGNFKHGGYRPRKDTNVNKQQLIDDFTWVDASLWSCLDVYPDINEQIVAVACGWKDARNIQFGNIFSRLNDLGDEKTYTALKNAIRWHNAE